METVSVSRTIAVPFESVESAMADVEEFMLAGGFSQAEVEDDRIWLRQNLGLGRIELDLAIVDDPDAVLAYEQRNGIFDEMRTRYELVPEENRTRVTATTHFELGGVVGSVLDATIVKRKRRSELNRQFDYLESAVDSA